LFYGIVLWTLEALSNGARKWIANIVHKTEVFWTSCLMPDHDLTGPNRMLYTVLIEAGVSVANNFGLRRMIAGWCDWLQVQLQIMSVWTVVSCI